MRPRQKEAFSGADSGEAAHLLIAGDGDHLERALEGVVLLEDATGRVIGMGECYEGLGEITKVARLLGETDRETSELLRLVPPCFVIPGDADPSEQRGANVRSTLALREGERAIDEPADACARGGREQKEIDHQPRLGAAARVGRELGELKSAQHG